MASAPEIIVSAPNDGVTVAVSPPAGQPVGIAEGANPQVIVSAPEDAVTIVVSAPMGQIVGITEGAAPNAFGIQRVDIPISFAAPLTAGEHLPGVMLDADVKFAVNFGGSAVTVRGSAPATSIDHAIEKVAPDGTVTQIGTLTVHADKSWVVTSVAGSEFTVPAGCAIQLTGPATPDGLLSNLIGVLTGSYS